MYINDKRKNPVHPFGDLYCGDLFAYTEGDEEVYYLMKIEEANKAVVLGSREGQDHLVGILWDFKDEEEVEPLHGNLEVWAK